MNKYHYFNINYQCDSNCIFCAADYGIANNKISRVLTPERFEMDLLVANIERGDKIRISGGEPTLSPYFFEILQICKKYGCKIDLTTNGHFFADIKNVEDILDFCPIIIRIPLFGLSERHDYLTGRNGNFDKTIKAIDNFSKYHVDKDFILNIKFLLCKATVDSNQDIFNFVYSRYGKQFEYTLSPLIISRKVLENPEELIDTNTNLIHKSREFIENENIDCDLLPLCLLSEKKRNEYLKQYKTKYRLSYNDSSVSIVQKESDKGQKCELCDVKNNCYGFLPSYLQYFGDDECHPLKIIQR